MEKIFEFANNHDVLNERSEWNKFIPYHSIWQRGILQITETGGEIRCVIRRVGIVDSEYCELFWEPGYVHGCSVEDAYRNEILWGVEQTHRWLQDRLIPHIKTTYQDDASIDQPKQSIIKKLLKKVRMGDKSD